MRAAQARYGRDVEMLAALGLGRSYGATSRILLRHLPGILQSGLWGRLESLPPAPTRALITDVGNDILFGAPAEQILAWVEECVERLQARGAEVVLAGLPIASIERLSNAKFLFFRSVLYPPCRLTRDGVLDLARRVGDGLEQLARRRGASFFPLRPEWYGIDPIHFRPGTWSSAWQQILGGEGPAAAAPLPFPETLRLYLMRPERQWLAGFEQTAPQPGATLRGGARIWLY